MNTHDEFANKLKALEEGLLSIEEFDFTKLNRLQIGNVAQSIEYRRTQEIQKLVGEINGLRTENNRLVEDNKELRENIVERENEKIRSMAKLDEIKNGLHAIEKKLLNADVQYKNMQGDLRLEIHKLQMERNELAAKLTMEMSRMLTALRILPILLLTEPTAGCRVRVSAQSGPV